MQSASDADQASSQDIFLNAWQTYRKVLTSNYMYHREVYDLLREILVFELARPFVFLDIACGDALASFNALKGTAVQSYSGIDISEAALTLARETLSELACPVDLQKRDFVEALPTWQRPVDVVWIGQSLHHLLMPDKRAVVRQIHRLLPPDGIFLFWEPTLLEGEDHSGWMMRFDSKRPVWPALDDAEWKAMRDHCDQSDYQETEATWLGLGKDAGFTRAEVRFVSPNGLSRVYMFRP